MTHGMRGFGDYDAELYKQVIAPAAGTPARQITATKPADAQPSPSTQMADDITTQWRTKFIYQPRESLPLIVPTAGITLPGGNTQATIIQVLQFTMSERNCGYLQSLKLVCEPDGSMQDVKWSLFLGQSALAQFSNLQFLSALTAEPIPCALEICANRTLTLKAQLNSANTADQVTVGAMFLGWYEYISQSKPYGNTPASGIG